MTRAELLAAVRAVIAGDTGRHEQGTWVSSRFDDEMREMGARDVAVLRRFASVPVPRRPRNPADPVCGTTGCVAGWAVILGSEPGTLVQGYDVILPSGARDSVASLAQELLGLDERRAVWLFSGGRTRDEIIWALGELIKDPDAGLDLDRYYCSRTG